MPFNDGNGCAAGLVSIGGDGGGISAPRCTRY